MILDQLQSSALRFIQFIKRNRISCFALIAYIVLSVIFYYPLSLHLATRTVESMPADGAFNMWIIGWGNHALTHYPWRFFEANMFYPFPHVLAWGDHLFSITLVAMPFIPFIGLLATYNMLLVMSCALCGFSLFLLIRYVTKNIPAAFLAGALWSLSQGRISDGHIQVLAIYWLPLIFLFAEKIRTKYSKRDLKWFILVLFMQLTTGIYVAFYTVVSFAIYGVVMLIGKKMKKPEAKKLALGWLIALSCSLPIYLPSLVLNLLHPTVRSLNEQSALTLSDVNPLAIPGKAWIGFMSYLHINPMHPVAGYSLGLVLLALILVIMAWSGFVFIKYKKLRIKHFPLVVAFLLIGIWGITSSFGPNITLWPGKSVPNIVFLIPYIVIPGYRVMRVASRWHFIGLFGLATFVGLCIGEQFKKLPKLLSSVFVVLAIIWLIIEQAPLDIGSPVAPNIADYPVYTWLKNQPGEFAIVELPIYPGKYYLPNDLMEGRRTFFSTYHWKKRASGAFSPFIPNRYLVQSNILSGIGSDPKAVELLHTINIRYVLLLPEDFAILGIESGAREIMQKKLDSASYLKKVYTSTTGTAYEVLP